MRKKKRKNAGLRARWVMYSLCGSRFLYVLSTCGQNHILDMPHVLSMAYAGLRIK